VAKLHKLDNHDRTVMPAINVVEMATRGGARALHLEDRLGSLESGKLADLIIVDHNATNMVPFYDVYSTSYMRLAPKTSARPSSTPRDHGRSKIENRRYCGSHGAYAGYQPQNRQRRCSGD